MTDTKIEWADRVWNPTRGCSRVSEGCTHCYAERFAARYSEPRPDPIDSGVLIHPPFEGYAKRTVSGPRWTGRVELIAKKLGDPLRWRKWAAKFGEPCLGDGGPHVPEQCAVCNGKGYLGRRPRVFVNSMSDLFHEKLSNEDIAAVFGVMAACEGIDFLALTKRPERMREWFEWIASEGTHAETLCLSAAARACGRPMPHSPPVYRWPLPNVWIGVSVENQETADERIPLLLLTPAAVRFVSYEPALAEVDFGLQSATCACCPRWPSRWVWTAHTIRSELPQLLRTPGGFIEPGIYRATGNQHGALSVMTPGGLLGIKPREFTALPGLDWIIAGGESGPGARPCDVAWIRSTVEQCKAAGVSCFVKQTGRWILGDHEGFRVNHWLLPNGVGYVPPIIGAHVGERPANAIGFSLWDRKGGAMEEWPEDLRVREFPK